jgi:hypothetical protein
MPDFNLIPSAVLEKKFLENRTAEQNLTKLGRDVSCEVLKSCPGLY